MPAVGAAAWRRLAAAGYDGLLLLALLMLLTAALQLATHGTAITPAAVGPWAYLYRVLLAAGICAYFGLAWTRRGQTLGMQAWDLRLESAAGARPGWRSVAARLALNGPLHVLAIGGVLMSIAQRAGPLALALCLAPLAAGYATFGPGRRTLVDRLTGTRVIRERR